MFAGHEASANTITFIILLLACHPRIQRLVQQDIDRILKLRPVSEWSYSRDYSLLSQSYVGAVINEALRLYTVIPYIYKSVSTPQPIIVDGRTHVIPAETLILMNTNAVHRHPNIWPKGPKSTAEYAPYPVTDFNPSAWLDKESEEGSGFLHPQMGSFMPFSDGSRGCLGRQFALVELCAIITRLFREHSVELVVKDQGLETTRLNKRALWQEARRRAEMEMSNGIELRMSLRMTKLVPVKFVNRGEENFLDDE